MVEKAPDAFRTISEVAGELDVPQHVLRFWETRFSHIKPMKRGGGRRYYRPADVDLLRGIKHLLYGEGYTIKGVQRILKEDGIKAVQSSWQEQDDADALDIGEAPQPSVETPRSAPVISRTVQPAGTAPVAREQVVQFAGIKPAQMSALTDCLKSLKECRAILKEAANV